MHHRAGRPEKKTQRKRGRDGSQPNIASTTIFSGDPFACQWHTSKPILNPERKVPAAFHETRTEEGYGMRWSELDSDLPVLLEDFDCLDLDWPPRLAAMS